MQNYHELAKSYVRPFFRKPEKISEFYSSAVLSVVINASSFTDREKVLIRDRPIIG